MGQTYFPLFWQDLAKNAFPSARGIEVQGLFTAGHIPGRPHEALKFGNLAILGRKLIVG